jgi:hypothetical protein
VNIKDALDQARASIDDTVLVLVSPRQAERLYLAMKIADSKVFGDIFPSFVEYNAAVDRYRELSEGK